MVYARRSYRSYYRPYRKVYRKKYSKRKRFSKKRFTKYSSKQKTIVRAPVNARETYVKLPWQVTSLLNANSLTSTTYVFLGNSLAPVYTTATPPPGSIWASGVSEYANFYERYRVLGASISIRMLSITSSIYYRCVLLPIMVGGPETTAGSITGRITELDALTYDQLAVQPYAQSRSVGVGAGGNAVINFKMFRKTKYMAALKDVRDETNLSCRLPNPDGSGGEILNTSDSAWFYYFRVFNPTQANGQIESTVKMKFYTQLYGRNNWVPTAVPS